jgi:hypothetical protein
MFTTVISLAALVPAALIGVVAIRFERAQRD